MEKVFYVATCASMREAAHYINEHQIPKEDLINILIDKERIFVLFYR